MRHARQVQFLAILMLTSLIGCEGLTWAQTATSSVSGSVKDPQAAAIPGATVTLVNAATRAERSTVTDGNGNWRFLTLAPGIYSLKVELEGFRTAARGGLVLPVDTATTLEPIVLSIGALSETVEVRAQALVVNTTDASLGNVMDTRQIMALPLEARNPVGLLSLQPGVVFLPTGQQRSGATSGARSDQSNVTLDGLDVNDPELGTAFTTVLRMPLDAIQEFRVTTTNYAADQGRSSGGQVSLITKTGTNQFRGSAYWVTRNTATSSNEYFLKLAQLQAGEPSKPPKLDKQIFGGALGGPVTRNRLFFFANYEQLQESSESPVARRVPSEALRDGILQYPCAEPGACPGGRVQGVSGAFHTVQQGYYGLSPAELRAIDPLGIGANAALLERWKTYPTPNDPGVDGVNSMAYRFAAPIDTQFRTFVSRADYAMAVRHRLFARVNLMRDGIDSAPRFPDQRPAATQKAGNWGVATGYDAVIGSQKVNTLRYGYTGIRQDTAGQLDSDYVLFPETDDVPPTASNGRAVSTHNIVEDFSWLKANHVLRFGANMRFTRNRRNSNANAFFHAVAGPSASPNGGYDYIPGRSTCTTPGCAMVPATDPDFYPSYPQPFFNVLGVLNFAVASYNFDRDGQLVPHGSTIRRRFATDEYEFYAMDSWQATKTLTIGGGLRWSISSPPWETNGLQVAPTTSLGEWFDQRGANAAKGIPASAMPLFQFDLAGAANDKKGFYGWQYKNIAPRVSAAWTPAPTGGWLKRLTGDDRLVLRGGYALVYDHLGLALASDYDGIANAEYGIGGAYGLQTTLTSGFGVADETTPGVRFVSPTTMPPILPPAPPVSFPYEPPLYANNIGVSMDDTIRTPYAHTVNAVVGRELPGNFGVEAAYVGRFGRRLLVRRDLATPANLVDPQSGVDYFTAAGALIQATHAKQIAADADASAYEGLDSIPYWEHLFPEAAQNGLTATQAIAMAFNSFAPDYVTALFLLDQYCSPACSVFGPYAYFSPQFSALATLSSVGSANYHSLQMTVRKRWSRGYQFDVNYTWSKSEDLGSSVERGTALGYGEGQGMGGISGLLMNPWQPERQWGPSDFDVRHQLNINWVAELPFGKGRTWGADASQALNAFIGDWSIAGLMRLTSGFPFNVMNCSQCWATNYNAMGNAELVTPGTLPATAVTKNAIDGYPSAFADPEGAVKHFRYDLPGEVGIRNQLRGDGYFTIDLSVSKSWGLPAGSLQFRWDTFNLTNTPRFDVATATMYPDRPGFGRYNSTLATCDGRAGRCMQFALRYEF
jgi:hypothetical protein